MTLLFLTKLVEPLPKAALAAVVMVAVYPLVEVYTVKTLWKEKRRDLAVMLITFVCTLGIGILQGLLIGMGLSILILAYNNAYPEIDVLGNIPNTTTYKSRKVNQFVFVHPSIAVLNVGASLNFTNMSHVKTELAKTRTDSIKVVILDCHSVYDVDSTAIRLLKEIISDFYKKKVKICLANLHPHVEETLSNSGIISDNYTEKQIPTESVYYTTHEAVTDCITRYIEPTELYFNGAQNRVLPPVCELHFITENSPS